MQYIYIYNIYCNDNNIEYSKLISIIMKETVKFVYRRHAIFWLFYFIFFPDIVFLFNVPKCLSLREYSLYAQLYCVNISKSDIYLN